MHKEVELLILSLCQCLQIGRGQQREKGLLFMDVALILRDKDTLALSI